MIYLLILNLIETYTFLNVFAVSYCENWSGSLYFTYGGICNWKPIHQFIFYKTNFKSIREDGPDEHIVKIGTPTMGGVTYFDWIIFGESIFALGGGEFNKYLYMFLNLYSWKLWILGAFDDYKK